MSFAARCPFCQIQLNGVPIEYEGRSICCPRCESYFTLAAGPDSTARTRIGASHRVPGQALQQACTAPSSVSGPGEPELQPDATPGSPEQTLNRFGVLSFFLGALALLCASIPSAWPLVLPLAGAGLLAAGAGALVPSAREVGLQLVAAGGAVSAAVVIIVSCWPTMLHIPTQTKNSKQSADTQLVYRPARTGNLQRLAPKQTEWANASQEGVQQAGVRVRLNGAAVMPVVLKTPGGQHRRGEPSLVIRLRISNAAADRLVAYQSWSRPADKAPRLEDDTGKSYALRDLGSDQAVGQIRQAWLPMAKWVDDVLVFEKPAGKIEWLRLELPCARVGLTGQFRLEIPRRLIAFQ
jgi:hypothetical protein